MENNFKSSAVFNLIWKFCERFLAQIISLIVTIILARILTPDDYGVVSLVAIFFAFSNVLITGGLNTALIQKKDADSTDYSTVLFVSVAISIIIYLVLFFTSPLLADLYNKQQLVPIIRVMSLALPLNAVKSIWCAYISANLKFKKFFFATLVGTVVSSFVGILMALRGYGAWALVAQQLTNITLDTLILILSTRIKITTKLSYKRFKKLFSYSWKVFVSSLIAVIYTECVPLAIGVKYDDDDLAYYTKGKSFPLTISNSIASTLSAVLFPILSKVQENKDKVLHYTRLYIKLSSYIMFPFMIGFAVVSDNFVIALLGEKWLSASYYIKIFCIVTMFDIVAIGNCETIKAIGRSDVYLKMEIIKKTCYFAIIIIFMIFSNSPNVLAISSICCTIVQILVNAIPNIKLIGYKLKLQIIDLLPNLIITVIMGIGVEFLNLINFNVNIYLLLIVQVLFGGILYLTVSILFKNYSFKYLVGLLKQIFRRKKVVNN